MAVEDPASWVSGNAERVGPTLWGVCAPRGGVPAFSPVEHEEEGALACLEVARAVEEQASLYSARIPGVRTRAGMAEGQENRLKPHDGPNCW